MSVCGSIPDMNHFDGASLCVLSRVSASESASLCVQLTNKCVPTKMESLLFRVSLLPLSLLLCAAQVSSDAVDEKVSGVCNRPNLPPNANIRFTAPEKRRFGENETVYIICETQFPHHIQKRVCTHGTWQGEEARCGKAVATNVNKIEAFKCGETHDPIITLDINQTDETQFPLPTNSFHFTRVGPETNVSVAVSGSNCYRWIITFEKKIEIAFLLLDINTPNLKGQNDTPLITVDINHRVCKLQHSSSSEVELDLVYGNYFFCDLKAGLGNETTQYITDFLVMNVQTSTNRFIGLEAVFVGETFKKEVKKMNTTDCGKMEIKRTGALEQSELSHTIIKCNDSFIEEGAPKVHKYVCDANGLWQGTWPVCVPKKTCPKGEILEELDSSVVIEQIGNVYYSNATHWDAIDYTWVRYACANLDSGIMVGRNDRLCMHGSWSNKMPSCTLAPDILPSSTLTISVIVSILVLLIVVFSLIVYLSVKKMNQKLKSTKSELQATVSLNKQYSQDYYTDLHELDTIYEDINKDLYSVPMYETSETSRRYMAEPRAGNTEHEYLAMTEGVVDVRKETPEYINY